MTNRSIVPEDELLLKLDVTSGDTEGRKQHQKESKSTRKNLIVIFVILVAIGAPVIGVLLGVILGAVLPRHGEPTRRDFDHDSRATRRKIGIYPSNFSLSQVHNSLRLSLFRVAVKSFVRYRLDTKNVSWNG